MPRDLLQRLCAQVRCARLRHLRVYRSHAQRYVFRLSVVHELSCIVHKANANFIKLQPLVPERARAARRACSEEVALEGLSSHVVLSLSRLHLLVPEKSARSPRRAWAEEVVREARGDILSYSSISIQTSSSCPGKGVFRRIENTLISLLFYWQVKNKRAQRGGLRCREITH